eukprot:CAMPEP_0202958264 /NCGR_PEP_ID=MMETSP1396-20130829/2626_1 /ASSEMBLY_ACC=CAM_ASM_000872 /TAXON_ID= /ORGANISM="Pseudokeronopsis sp., Strain Brazil" /LENGTH=96 /DNA_ID=CAMNT_0049676237 /DNA_START=693 /DNA_END=983 /DNA_ORIENTATION=-
MAPLGVMGLKFEIDWNKVMRHSFEGKMVAFTNMVANISLFQIFPLMNIKALESVIDNSDVVLLKGYGLGNVPSDNKELLKIIKEGVQKGKIIVVLT